MNEKGKKRYKIFENILNIGLYIGFVLILLVCISEKTNLHCDEVYTYVLSNNTASDTITVSPDYYNIYDEPQQVWIEKMGVSSGEGFNYRNVWEKQAQDTHPPLYYSLVHTVSSIFPETYSKWFAGSINLVFGVLTLYIIRRIVTELTDKKSVMFLVSCCFIFSAGVLSAMTFFRMYIVAMFFATLISYIFLRGMERDSYKFYVALYIASFLGALTHYYVVIYLFFICLVFGIYLIIRKQWKRVGIFVLTMLAAGATAICIFPTMITHVFGDSNRGAETMNQLSEGSWTYFLYKLRAAYDIIDSQLFGGLLLVLMLASVICFIISVIMDAKKKESVKKEMQNEEKSNSRLAKWLLLWIPVICYYLAVAKIAVFITDRYFHIVYGLLIVLVVSTLCVAFQKIIPPKAAFFVLFIILVFATFREFGDNWFYLYRGTGAFLERAAEYDDKDCIMIFHKPYEIDPAFYEVSNYDRVVFVPDWSIDEIHTLQLNTDEGLIVSVSNDSDFEMISAKLRETWVNLDAYEMLGGHSFSQTYYFY